MNALDILKAARADGLRLHLSPDGVIKARGNAAALEKWQDAIKANRATIIEKIKSEAPFTDTERSNILAWLNRIGETDQSIIDHTIYLCMVDAGAREYFSRQAEAQYGQTTPACNGQT